MIVGFGGSGLGISRQQSEALKAFLRRLPLEVAIHRGSSGMESMIHNVIRSVYPRIPVHVVPLIGCYSSIASQPLPQFPQTICYQAGSPDEVNTNILKAVHGIVFLPSEMREGSWDLAYEAREQAVPIFYIWPNGKLSLERNEL